ncbi:MAG: copper amine oxidase N-terminal domain-containing protein [Clostridiales bacterium]|nr:copper amine oxidase N-terminal domain-containing protein [Clostridiales bacterium]
MNINRRLRRALSAVLTLAAVLALGLPVLGMNAVDAITASLADKTPAFNAFTGTVIELRQNDEDPSRTYVMLENADEELVNFVLAGATYLPDGLAIEEGLMLTGYYDLRKPAVMIYPPQYEAVAFWVPGNEPPFVKVDIFDADWVSSDGLLKLVDYVPAEDVTDKTLMVFYDVSTRSIPSQTSPVSVVVLGEAATQAEPPEIPAAGTGVPLMVNGALVQEIPLTFAEDGAIIVPLYLVCQGLEVNLGWDGENQVALVADTYPVVIGTDGVIIEDRTYVTLDFFTGVMGLNAAEFADGQIQINE